LDSFAGGGAGCIEVGGVICKALARQGSGRRQSGVRVNGGTRGVGLVSREDGGRGSGSSYPKGFSHVLKSSSCAGAEEEEEGASRGSLKKNIDAKEN
jgi:hypothetical protein